MKELMPGGGGGVVGVWGKVDGGTPSINSIRVCTTLYGMGWGPI